MLLTLTAPDNMQRQEIEALFDRTEAFSQWRDTASTLQAELAQLTETEARRRQRNVADALQALHRIDYYPGAAAAQADADLASLQQALDACFSRGEPAALPAHGIKRLDTAQFQNQRWATRARPWVDRLACAWLIRRFVDPAARFVWLADPASPPADVLGFDFDGARFTHVGALVTFEVLIASFGLETDPACSAWPAPCTTWIPAACPCPKPPGWRPCWPACAKCMPMTMPSPRPPRRCSTPCMPCQPPFHPPRLR